MIQLGGIQVANGSDPYIIAAIDNNWQPQSEDPLQGLIQSIEQAKLAGANAVKFLFRNFEGLYGTQKVKKSSYNSNYELSEDWLSKLKNTCDRFGIHFMASVFDPDDVRIVDPYVHAHHITSGEIHHIALLKELCRIRKPVFVHVGGAIEEEIKITLAHLESTPVVLMYGVESGENVASKVDLTKLEIIRNMGGMGLIGFFDKTLDVIYLPYAAAKFHKAAVIEKHLNAIGTGAGDSLFSISQSDFMTMVQRIRNHHKAFLGVEIDEIPMMRKQKRRLVATDLVRQGDIFRYKKNYGTYLPQEGEKDGLYAIEYMDIDGRKALKDVEAGQVISSECVQR